MERRDRPAEALSRATILLPTQRSARGLRDAFLAHSAAAEAAFTGTRPGHWRVDLYALARRRLHSVGVDPAQISGGQLCSIDDPQRFYSHRRDRRTGRMATLAWIEP